MSSYTFLTISPRKTNILKKPKLSPVELKELYEMNPKKNTAQFIEYLEIYYKNVKKMKKNKSAQKFFILKYAIERFKTSKLYY